MTTPPPQRPVAAGSAGQGQPAPGPRDAADPATRPAAGPPTEQIRPRSHRRGADDQFAAALRPPAASAHRRQPPSATAAPSLPDGQTSPAKSGRGRGFLNRQSIILIAVIIVALVAGGLAGAELYARHRADGVLVEVAECVVQDGVTISYGVNPPFLWQHITGHYTNISVSTAGNNVQDATGMTADVTVSDVRLRDTGDSKGTIGSLDRDTRLEVRRYQGHSGGQPSRRREV